ncbi:hypothetical protein OG985_29470 [Streptomyces sp. NBC_00289]|uniref:hypothetical protein n=1 Tax=Streptomyces sp. NBC_00289 TaxID=2975703 RepID=UPI00324B83B5
MRALPARRIASTALCATLLLAIAAPAALAAESHPDREHTRAASHQPVADAEALVAQVKSLGDLGDVLTPVTDLLNAVLKSDSGQLSAVEANSLVEAVKTAVGKIIAATPAATATTPATTLPATPVTTLPATALPATSAAADSTVVVQALPAAPVLTTSAGDSKAAAPSADLTDDALTELETAIDALVKAATSGDVSQVGPAVTDLMTDLVNLLTATLLDSGLPAPSLEGLPELPALPAAPEVPAVPETPAEVAPSTS